MSSPCPPGTPAQVATRRRVRPLHFESVLSMTYPQCGKPAWKMTPVLECGRKSSGASTRGDRPITPSLRDSNGALTRQVVENPVETTLRRWKTPLYMGCLALSARSLVNCRGGGPAGRDRPTGPWRCGCSTRRNESGYLFASELSTPGRGATALGQYSVWARRDAAVTFTLRARC
jgi:hypothetical protein